MNRSVSLLTDFELCDEPYDWDLGTHGIYIQFPSMPTTPSESSSLPSKSTIKISYNSLSSLPPYILPPQTNGTRTRTLSATFLPDVPPEQGWTKLETLNSAISKAGYKGMIDEKVRKSCRVIRYQSRKILVGHEEWNSSREG